MLRGPRSRLDRGPHPVWRRIGSVDAVDGTRHTGPVESDFSGRYGFLCFSGGGVLLVDRAKSESFEFLRAAQGGDTRPLWAALERDRDRLRRMVALRMHPRVQGRIDASDVVQESFMEVSRRLDQFLDEDKMPFFIWVRFLTLQKLQQLHRFHLGAKARDARREVATQMGLGPAASSVQIAQTLAASGLSPSENLAEEEQIACLEQALEELPVEDVEIIALRHFEELANAEIAHVFGLTESAASHRYLSAIRRVKALLERDAR